MSASTFRMQIPADGRYRALAAEVAARYVALTGGSDAEAASLEATLSEALAGCGDSDLTTIDLRFREGPTELEVELACGSRSSVIRHPLPAGRLKA
jgi:hypothetical protein